MKKGLFYIAAIAALASAFLASCSAKPESGVDGATEYWRDYGSFEALLITDDGRMLITEGLRGSFIQSGDAYAIEYVSETEEPDA